MFGKGSIGRAVIATRQQIRRELFAENMSAVNRENVQRTRRGKFRRDEGGNGKFTMLRAERRNLARAYAAGEWRGERELEYQRWAVTA